MWRMFDTGKIGKSAMHAEPVRFDTINIEKYIENVTAIRYNMCVHIYFLSRMEETLMSIFVFSKRKRI